MAGVFERVATRAAKLVGQARKGGGLAALDFSSPDTALGGDSSECDVGCRFPRSAWHDRGMPRRLPPIPRALGDQFGTRDAIASGVSPSRLRARDLEIPFRGSRMLRAAEPSAPASAPSFDRSPHTVEAEQALERFRGRAFAYACIMPAHSFFIGISAAVFFEVPVPLHTRSWDAAGDRPVDVGVFAPYRASRSAGVRGAQLVPKLVSVCEREGVRLSSPASTWAMLGSELTVDELVVAGDAIVRIPRQSDGRRGDPGKALAMVSQLAAAVSAGRRRGAAVLREALSLIRVGSASPPETDLRLALLRDGLPEPALDFDVIGTGGEFIGYTELAYPQWRVLIEYEGDHHRTSRKQWNRDVEKHAQCVALGWTVLRITSAHLYPSPAPAVARIRATLERAGWHA